MDKDKTVSALQKALPTAVGRLNLLIHFGWEPITPGLLCIKLREHFDLDRLNTMPYIKDGKNTLVEEANLLLELFPKVSDRYIQHHLGIYHDLPNRVELVLRQIVYNCNEDGSIASPPTSPNSITGVKRPLTTSNAKDHDDGEKGLETIPAKVKKSNGGVTWMVDTNNEPNDTSVQEQSSAIELEDNGTDYNYSSTSSDTVIEPVNYWYDDGTTSTSETLQPEAAQQQQEVESNRVTVDLELDSVLYRDNDFTKSYQNDKPKLSMSVQVNYSSGSVSSSSNDAKAFVPQTPPANNNPFVESQGNTPTSPVPHSFFLYRSPQNKLPPAVGAQATDGNLTNGYNAMSVPPRSSALGNPVADKNKTLNSYPKPQPSSAVGNRVTSNNTKPLSSAPWNHGIPRPSTTGATKDSRTIIKPSKFVVELPSQRKGPVSTVTSGDLSARPSQEPKSKLSVRIGSVSTEISQNRFARQLPVPRQSFPPKASTSTIVRAGSSTKGAQPNAGKPSSTIVREERGQGSAQPKTSKPSSTIVRAENGDERKGKSNTNAEEVLPLNYTTQHVDDATQSLIEEANAKIAATLATLRNHVEVPDLMDHEEEVEEIRINATPDVAGEQLFTVDQKLVSTLCSMFPDACPNYVKGLCVNLTMDPATVDNLVTKIFDTEGQYPKRRPTTPEPTTEQQQPEAMLRLVQEFLPDADPDYLQMKCEEFSGNHDAMMAFVNEATEIRNYPTLKDYTKRQQVSAQLKQYTTEFSVENFVKLIPDPKAFFSDKKRIVKLDPMERHFVYGFLRNQFDRLPIRTISSALINANDGLYHAYKILQKAMTNKTCLMKTTRKKTSLCNNLQNIPLAQEVAYLNHEIEILEYLKKIKDDKKLEIENARLNKLMQTCGCCYDEDVLPKDTFCCPNGCAFCKQCIEKGTEVLYGEGKLDYPCLMSCGAFFTLQTLQAVLCPKLFSKIAQKKAVEEVKAAGIEELATCPFCDFATIPAEGDKIFHCLNPECMKESCRMCNEPSHVPLRCDEIEKDAEVKARVFVEDQMTEALIKKCYKCGTKFFKEEGCNKMRCTCGANMCYICGAAVEDYTHFNGQGGDRFDLCPLYSDTNVLNKENVLKGAEAAKAQLGVKELKNDPTKDVDSYFNERAKKLPKQNLVNPEQVLHFQREAMQILQRREDYNRDRLQPPPNHHNHINHPNH